MGQDLGKAPSHGRATAATSHDRGEPEVDLLGAATRLPLAKLIGENEFPNQFHEGAKDSLYMTLVGGRVVLVVIFDNRTSLGLVRLRIKKASDELDKIFVALAGPEGEVG